MRPESGLRQSRASLTCPSCCVTLGEACLPWVGAGWFVQDPSISLDEMFTPGGTQARSKPGPLGLLTGKEFTKFQLSFWVRKRLIPQLRMIWGSCAE